MGGAGTSRPRRPVGCRSRHAPCLAVTISQSADASRVCRVDAPTSR